MSASITAAHDLREAARELYDLRARCGLVALDSALDQLPDDDIADLLSCWQLYARPSQLRPATCKPIWLRQAGRGEGKTRAACERSLDRAEDLGPDFVSLLASKTIGDVINVMVEGRKSGLLACARRRGYELEYIPSKSQVRHPAGGIFYLVSCEKPDKPRGYECTDFWADEIAAWTHAITMLDNMIYAWRLPCPGGKQAIITTTPKPNPIMLRLLKDPAFREIVTITRGRTRDNAANLEADTVRLLESVYLGTKLGRQELDGELLDALGAVVEQDTIHRFRVRKAPELARRIVSLDPSITAKETSDDAGIVVLGSDYQDPADAYLLADGTLEQATFGMWARRAVLMFLEWDCDCVVAEVNQGGGGIAEAIQVAAAEVSKEIGREVVVPVRSIWAKESKRARAEPVGALYERGRIHHVGHFEQAEREITRWLPGMDSPNRMDAIVHGVTHLLLGDKSDVGPIRGYFQ